jgi:hypothetical protein
MLGVKLPQWRCHVELKGTRTILTIFDVGMLDSDVVRKIEQRLKKNGVPYKRVWCEQTEVVW